MNTQILMIRVVLFSLASIIAAPLAHRAFVPKQTRPLAAEPTEIPEIPGTRVIDVVLTGSTPVLAVRPKQTPTIAACPKADCGTGK